MDQTSLSVHFRSSGMLLLDQCPFRSNSVKQQPIHRDLENHLRKLHWIARLLDKAIGAKRITLVDLLLVFAGGQNYDGQSAGLELRTYALKDLETTQLGKLQIEDNDGRHHGHVATGKRARSKEIVDRFLAIAGNNHLVHD